jgi:hypothetical protein
MIHKPGLIHPTALSSKTEAFTSPGSQSADSGFSDVDKRVLHELSASRSMVLREIHLAV